MKVFKPAHVDTFCSIFLHVQNSSCKEKNWRAGVSHPHRSRVQRRPIIQTVSMLSYVCSVYEILKPSASSHYVLICLCSLHTLN